MWDNIFVHEKSCLNTHDGLLWAKETYKHEEEVVKVWPWHFVSAVAVPMTARLADAKSSRNARI